MRHFLIIALFSATLISASAFGASSAQAARPALCCSCLDSSGQAIKYPILDVLTTGKSDAQLKELCKAARVGGGVSCQDIATDCPKVDDSGCFTAENGYTFCALENPLVGNEIDLNKILGRILRYVLGLMGALALLMIVRGGHIILTAAGNPEKVKKGTQTVLWAVIGVFLVLASYFLLGRLISLITTGTA